MKLAPSTKTPVEILGVEAPQQAFQIRASAMAFKILSEGLYSDKIRAVIRELSTNAYDAHLEAGKGQVPIKVHLPTRFEPWFSVTDEGVGMDHERVMNNYTTYFGSTKQDTNDLVGCLGLGSKSPFAYTETFTVVSTKDGVRRTYTALISDEGFPKIMLLDEAETDTPNGVLVQFPVKVQDMQEFSRKARVVYTDFPVKPSLNTSEPIPEVTYSLQGTNWGLRDNKTNRLFEWGTRVRVIQGCVAYPLDGDEIDFTHPLLESHVDIRVPIGAVETTPGRESLSYTKHTKDNIRVALDEIQAELLSTYLGSFKGCTTRVQALLKLQELQSSGGDLLDTVYEDILKADLGGFSIGSERMELDLSLFANVNLLEYSRWTKGHMDPLRKVSREDKLAIQAGNVPAGLHRVHWLAQVRVTEKRRVIYNDLPGLGFKTLITRMAEARQFDAGALTIFADPYREEVSLGTTKTGKPLTKISPHPSAQSEAQAVADLLETTVEFASTFLESYPPPERKKSVRVKTKIRRASLGTTYSGTHSCKWEAQGMDGVLEGAQGEFKLYVVLEGRSVAPTKWYVDNPTMATFHQILRDFGILDGTFSGLYGVPPDEVKDIQDDPEWVSMVDLFEEWVKNVPKDDLLKVQSLDASVDVSTLQTIDLWVQGDKKLHGSWLDTLLSPHRDMLQAIRDVEGYWSKSGGRAKAIRGWMRTLGIPIPPLPMTPLTTFKGAFAKGHPMLHTGWVREEMLRPYVDMVAQMYTLQDKVLELETKLAQTNP